jgi:hypothetical protein
MATSNFPIYNYYILYTIYYILYLIYIYITLYAYYIIYYILWFYNIYGIYYWFYYIWYSFLWISHWNTILFVRIPISHDAPRAPPPRAAARGDRLRKAKTRGFSDRQIAQLVTAPDAGRIFNGDGETSGTWGVHQPEYKIFHGIHMENPLEKPYWKWWFNGD